MSAQQVFVFEPGGSNRVLLEAVGLDGVREQFSDSELYVLKVLAEGHSESVSSFLADVLAAYVRENDSRPSFYSLADVASKLGTSPQLLIQNLDSLNIVYVVVKDVYLFPVKEFDLFYEEYKDEKDRAFEQFMSVTQNIDL